MEVTVKYKCNVSGCTYETDNRYGYAGHMKGHKTPRTMKVVETIPTPVEIANALLNTVVDAINREQSLGEQLKIARSRIASLNEELTKAEGERDRVIKLHNMQIEEARKNGTNLPSTDVLMKLAKVR